MKIKSGREQDYKDWLDKNTDSYGRACFVYAEAWASLLEAQMLFNLLTPTEVIEKYADAYSNLADEVAGGITGFMYGAAVSILFHVWEYGDIIKRWHNRKYHCEDYDDVVNPAILTVEKR